MTLTAHRAETALACLLACAALLGCNQNQTPASGQAAAPPPPLPLTTAAPAPAPPAPAASALPPVPAAEIVYQDDPAQQYAYADQAADVANALGDAPPDYSYDDEDGSQPWVWRGEGYVRLAEPTPDGERYYYYNAGSQYPYLVQDGPYSYAYANGALVVVYGSDGRALSAERARAQLDLASRDLARARNLYSDALSRQRQAVAVQAWQDRRGAIQAERNRWAAEQVGLAAWSVYHQAHQAQASAQWSAERDRRAAEVQQYARAPSGPAPGPALAPAPAAPLPQARRDDQAQRRPGPPPAAAAPSPPPPKGPPPAHERGPGPDRPPAAQPAQHQPARPPQPAAAPAARAPAPVRPEPARPGLPRPAPAARPAPAPPAAHAPPPKAPPHPAAPPRDGKKPDDKKPPA